MFPLDAPIINVFRFAATAAFSLSVVTAALAHHGGGTFDNTKTIELTGTLTRLELINPHSWIYFDATGPDGTMRAYRCEMRGPGKFQRAVLGPGCDSGGRTSVQPGQV